MTALLPPLTPVQQEVLRAIADTAVPSLRHAEDPDGFWRTSGSDVGAHLVVEQYLGALDATTYAGLQQLMDGMAALGFQHQGRAVREAILHSAAALSDEATMGVQLLRGLCCLAAAAVPDDTGRNPFWPHFGYPGPVVEPPQVEPHIRPHVPTDGEVLEADVVVVGSGAGGGTIAGVLATQGKRVVVLEAGGAYDLRDYTQLELVANPAMMYRAGLAPTADFNVTLLAGATLGGGTAVNWQNCVKPADEMRREWAREHGLDGLDTEEFDRHLEAVLARMGATDRCSDLNGPHQRMVEGAKALGWSYHLAVRNVDEATYDPALAGYTQFGDPSGSKRGTLQTYLVDAFDAGAKILVRTRAEQVCVADGRATGVTAVYEVPETGVTARITVNAPTVVVAGGALETPALLLRSGIGGPAVGRHLRLHPAGGMFGVYAEDQQAWWGPPQAAVMDQFRDLDGEGYGVLVEGSQYYSGVYALQLARTDGREHKDAMDRFARMSHLLFITREHGGGTVTVDDTGQAVHTYSLDDPRDQAAFRKGIRVLAELHLAAGAEELWFGATPRVWKRGEDLDAWCDELDAMHIGAGGLFIGSAHQMGTARMGTDPLTSVAKPTGELHDVAGVWIGDTSAFPTPSGANPMLTCMALAHRTAEQILGRRVDDGGGSSAAAHALDAAPEA